MSLLEGREESLAASPILSETLNKDCQSSVELEKGKSSKYIRIKRIFWFISYCVAKVKKPYCIWILATLFLGIAIAFRFFVVKELLDSLICFLQGRYGSIRRVSLWFGIFILALTIEFFAYLIKNSNKRFLETKTTRLKETLVSLMIVNPLKLEREIQKRETVAYLLQNAEQFSDLAFKLIENLINYLPLFLGLFFFLPLTLSGAYNWYFFGTYIVLISISVSTTLGFLSFKEKRTDSSKLSEVDSEDEELDILNLLSRDLDSTTQASLISKYNQSYWQKRRREDRQRFVSIFHERLFLALFLVLLGVLFFVSLKLLSKDSIFPLGFFVVFLLLSEIILTLFYKIAKHSPHILKLDSYIRSLQDLVKQVDLLPQIKTRGTIHPKDVSSSIGVEVRGLTLRLKEGNKTIENINFKIKPGEKVLVVAERALIDALIERMLGFSDNQKGEVYLGGIELGTLYYKLRPKFITLSNTNELYPLSVRENITFKSSKLNEALGIEKGSFDLLFRDNVQEQNPKVVDSKWEEVVREANLESLITDLPSGLDTVLTRDFIKDLESKPEIYQTLKEKIALGRYLYHDPLVLLFDEPISTDEHGNLAHDKLFSLVSSDLDKTVLCFSSSLQTIKLLTEKSILRVVFLSEDGSIKSNTQFR